MPLTPISFAGLGGLITLLELGLHIFGVTPPPGSLEAALNGLLVFVGFILFVWGQVRRPDLKFGLVRKS